MKPHWIKVATGLLWMASSTCSVLAAPLELPLEPRDPEVTPAAAPVAASIDYSQVYDRHLDGNGSGDRDVRSGRVTESSQLHAKILYALNRYLNFYAKAGLRDWSEKLLFNDGGKTEIDFDLGFSWGVGVSGGYQFPKAWPVFSKGWHIFYDLQYLSTQNAEVSSVEDALRAVKSQAGEADYQDFHIAGGLGYQFHSDYEWASVIFPYVGARYSSLKITHNNVSWNTVGTYNLTSAVEEDSNFGIVSGIRFENSDHPNLSFRLEGRLLDETALTAAFDYRF